MGRLKKNGDHFVARKCISFLLLSRLLTDRCTSYLYIEGQVEPQQCQSLVILVSDEINLVRIQQAFLMQNIFFTVGQESMKALSEIMEDHTV